MLAVIVVWFLIKLGELIYIIGQKTQKPGLLEKPGFFAKTNRPNRPEPPENPETRFFGKTGFHSRSPLGQKPGLLEKPGFIRDRLSKSNKIAIVVERRA
ncbi:MAG: hypothetical protein F6J93_25125 [Oscillatoria sp. SIO1A7]|nr:hypothetical protein [Oscillatoria sp. SIO1A7]